MSTDLFPCEIVLEFDDADSAVAKRRELGDQYVVTAGFLKLYAIRRLRKMYQVDEPIPDCEHNFRSDYLNPHAVSCRKCGKRHHFAKITRADFDEAAANGN